MQYSTWFACEDCGTVVYRRKRVDRPMICMECGIRRSAENARLAVAARGLPRAEWLAVMRREVPLSAIRQEV